MLGLARALLDQRDDLARDAVQDTWLRVLRSAHAFAGRSSVSTWLYRILINRCHDLRPRATAPPSESFIDHNTRPATHTETRETVCRVQAAMANLPDGQRVVLVLCYHRAMTHARAADVLGIPVGTLKSRLAAALTALRAALAETPDEPSPAGKEEGR